jgi:hydrogenase maturation protease
VRGYAELMPDDHQGVLVIGIGTAYRNDDSAGLVAAQRLREVAPGAVRIIEHEGEGVALIDLLAGSEAAILIDATRSGTGAGTVQRFDAHADPLPAQMFRHSTHAFGVASALELARVLHRLPPQLIVYGIEGRDFAAGTRLSHEIEEALPGLVERVIREIRNLRSP